MQAGRFATARKRGDAALLSECKGARDGHARLKLRKMSEGKHPHPDKKKLCKFLDGVSGTRKRELLAIAGEEMEVEALPRARKAWQSAKQEEEEGDIAKAGYGVSVPLLSLERLCPAYGNTAEGLSLIHI